MTEENNENRPASKQNNLLLAGIGILVVLGLLGAGYYFLGMKAPEENSTPNETSDVLGLKGEGPVARVNGTEISREEYRRGVEQLTATYATQGVTISDEQAATVKDQVVNNLVNRQLVLEAANKAGTQATDAEVETEFQKVVSNFNDSKGLEAALTEAGITEEALRADIKTSVIINNYLSSKVDMESLTVTDKEVADYYETAKARAGTSTTEVPPLADVAELIKNQLLTEKQQQALSVEIEKLRTGANIEILI